MAARAPSQTCVFLAQSHLHHRPRRRQHSLANLLPPQASTRHVQCYHHPRLRSPRAHLIGSVEPQRTFTSSTPRKRDQQPDHYAILGLDPTAPGKEIKKKFYALSKKHHPDVTRHLPESEAAQHRAAFEKISDAYHTLGDPERKSKYDRERNPTPNTSFSGGSPGAAQYSRGGRPASGLSRRRSTFRGPPPSFYRSGGWGEGSGAGQRQQDARDTAEKQRAYANSTKYSDPQPGSTEGWPFSTDPNNVPHFDRASHYRTTMNVEEQLRQGRQKRRSLLFQARQDAMARGTGQGADAIFTPEEIGAAREIRSFGMVAGLLVVGCGGGYLIFGHGWTNG